MDLVIVPSNFTKTVVLDSSEDNAQRKDLDRKVIVIPEYYHTNFDIEHKDKCLNLNNILDSIKTDFNYLSVGQLTSESENCDRKNLIETLRYFCNHFKDNQEVGLILKTSIGRSTTLDKDKTKDVFSNIIKETKGDAKYPRVYILHGDLSIDELYTLYSHDKVNCYVTLTKGEGYGLPLLESARCGLPIIATQTGDSQQILTDIGNRIVPVRDSNSIATAVKDMKNMTSAQLLSIGERNRSKIVNYHSLSHIADQYGKFYERFKHIIYCDTR